MSPSGAPSTNASPSTQDAFSFRTLQDKLDPALLEALRELKYDSMTNVQERVLHELPNFRHDCLVQAKTGTGKTIAFLLPAIQNTLVQSPEFGQVSILILSPTRELALQIAAEAKRLVSRLKKPLQIHTAFGGSAKATALSTFLHGDPKVLVATPGRLNDYLSEANVRLKFRSLKTLILDEADRMLDAGFLPDILKILQALPPKAVSKGAWQGMAFSATLPPKMDSVLKHVLNKNHIRISTLSESEPPTLDIVPQYSVIIPGVEKTLTSLHSLLIQEMSTAANDSKIIVFGTTANLVSLFAKVFTNHIGSLPVFELHSRLSQPARTKASNAFKSTKNGVMFASDVIGRGMDFPDVSLVLQVGLPADADAYTHRVGRTGRAGKGGRAIILLTQAESFFLGVNRQFPIIPYPGQSSMLESCDQRQISISIQETDPKVKQKAYSAYLGFMKGFLNKLQMKPHELVEMANKFAVESMLCNEIPEMEKKTIGKMGLKGVRGIRYRTFPDQPTTTQRRTATESLIAANNTFRHR